LGLQLQLLLQLSLTFFSQPQNRHFDRSCSRSHREQRSGEIRFSTQPHLSHCRVFAVALAFVVGSGIRVGLSAEGSEATDPLLLPLSVIGCHPSPTREDLLFTIDTSL
jgi:hypothetical protein